ncbi:MAG: hypothetical protein RL090_928, partial [Bacteroidota bacterium]
MARLLQYNRCRMRTLLVIAILFILQLGTATAQTDSTPVVTRAVIINGDTVPFMSLPVIEII